MKPRITRITRIKKQLKGGDIMDENEAVNLRKLQEQSRNLIVGGLHNEIAKWHRAIYGAYIKVGFTPEQALELVKASIKGS